MSIIVVLEADEAHFVLVPIERLAAHALEGHDRAGRLVIGRRLMLPQPNLVLW